MSKTASGSKPDAKAKDAPASEVKVMKAKEARFVDEYVVDMNGAQAAIRAGYSAKTAKEIAYELLNRSHIAAAVQVKQQELSAKTGVTAQRVIQETARLALSDIAQLFDEAGTPLSPHLLPEDVRRSIASIEIEHNAIRETKTYKYKFWDKNAALEKLFKHLGIKGTADGTSDPWKQLADAIAGSPSSRMGPA
jgi:phage terminase small subunit